MFANKNALVTGISSPIGAAIAEMLRSLGYTVYGTWNEHPVEGDTFFHCNFAEPGSVSNLIGQLPGDIDVVVVSSVPWYPDNDKRCRNLPTIGYNLMLLLDKLSPRQTINLLGQCVWTGKIEGSETYSYVLYQLFERSMKFYQEHAMEGKFSFAYLLGAVDTSVWETLPASAKEGYLKKVPAFLPVPDVVSTVRMAVEMTVPPALVLHNVNVNAPLPLIPAMVGQFTY